MKINRYSNYNLSNKSTRAHSKVKITPASCRKSPTKHLLLTKKMILPATRSFQRDQTLFKTDKAANKIKSEQPSLSSTIEVGASSQHWFYPHNPKRAPKKLPLFPQVKAHPKDKGKKGIYYLKKCQDELLGVDPGMVGTN